MQVQRIQFNNPYISFQSNKKSWETLKALLSDPNGSDGYHPINYKYEEAIAKTKCLPTFNKKHFEYTDYQNLSPKERRIIGILNKKGTFKLDENYTYTRDNMSINRDAERVLKIAVTTKDKLDMEYKNGYKLVGIGRSPAAIVETMNLLGADTIAMPFSKDVLLDYKFPFGYTEYIGDGYRYPIRENFETKDWENYFKYFGIDKNFSQKTGKTLIFTDYVCDGGTKNCLESILKGLGFDDKNTKFIEIFDLMPTKEKFLADDYIRMIRCFDNRVFDVYGKIERIANFLHKINIIKHPEYYQSLPETFMSKLFRCAIYDLIKEKKLKMFI